MYHAPMLNYIRFIIDSILSYFYTLDPVVDILADILLEVGMSKRVFPMGIFIKRFIDDDCYMSLRKDSDIEDEVLISTKTRVVFNVMFNEQLAFVKFSPALGIDFIFGEKVNESFFVVENILLVGTVQM